MKATLKAKNYQSFSRNQSARRLKTNLRAG